LGLLSQPLPQLLLPPHSLPLPLLPRWVVHGGTMDAALRVVLQGLMLLSKHVFDESTRWSPGQTMKCTRVGVKLLLGVGDLPVPPADQG
jgi:hypothetical protein